MKFTERSLRILKYAEQSAKRTTQIVYPVHILIGMLRDKTGVCAELFLTNPNLETLLNKRIKETYFNHEEQGMRHECFATYISPKTDQVLKIAHQRMKRFKQVYINEGHLADAIFRNNDPLTDEIFTELDVSHILAIMSKPRDMIVSLKDYAYPNMSTSHITFRRAKKSDAEQLKVFVKKEFGKGWLDSIENGFLKTKIPIFIALNNNDIVGFACFDVVRKKQGIFGPMGTSFTSRVRGIGYTLLHLCLREMKEIGYAYAVIGEAGPVEFYEKACNAVVIPKHSKYV